MRREEPATLAASLERGGRAPDGPGQRFSGYSVLGVTFVSGDVLALRRYPISSAGPPYTCVWHCSPEGRWTFFTDVAGHGCAEYFEPALDEVVVAPIRIEWSGPRRIVVAVDGGQRLTWSLLMQSTFRTRAFNACAPRLAPVLAKHPRRLGALALVSRALLGTGHIRLTGLTPTGARFANLPWAVWSVRSSRACIAGADTGPDQPLDRHLSLGDVRIPRRGLFAASHALISQSER